MSFVDCKSSLRIQELADNSEIEKSRNQSNSKTFKLTPLNPTDGKSGGIELLLKNAFSQVFSLRNVIYSTVYVILFYF